MTTPGIFLVIEGADGVGTTTQAKLVYDHLTQRRIKSVLTAEPSTGAIGRLIRSVLQKETKVQLSSRGMAALFFADRVDHLGTVVEPALQRGEWVVCDRHFHSSLVYQGLALEDQTCAAEEAHWVQQLHQGALPVGYTLVLDVPFCTARARRIHRAEPEQVFESDAYQQRVIAAYRRMPNWDWTAHVIECGEDAIDVVHAKIVKTIDHIIESFENGQKKY